MSFAVTRLTTISRQLYVSVPRALARELGWPVRGYVKVSRAPNRGLTVELLKEQPRGRAPSDRATAAPDPSAG